MLLFVSPLVLILIFDLQMVFYLFLRVVFIGRVVLFGSILAKLSFLQEYAISVCVFRFME